MSRRKRLRGSNLALDQHLQAVAPGRREATRPYNYPEPFGWVLHKLKLWVLPKPKPQARRRPGFPTIDCMLKPYPTP